jgi:hypothetical protein
MHVLTRIDYYYHACSVHKQPESGIWATLVSLSAVLIACKVATWWQQQIKDVIAIADCNVQSVA